MLARAAGDSPSFVKLPVNHATTASGLNHHDYHSHTNKPPRRAARPHTGRYTRYVALHPLRGAAPDQNGCNAYGSGAPPTPTSSNADTHTSPGAGSAPSTTATHQLDRHCATYSPTQCSASSATLPLTSPTADTPTSPRTGTAPPTTATHYLDRHCATHSPAQRPPSSATLPLTNPTAARVATTQGTTSTTGHCTRYVALHLLRGAAPVQNGCIAYGSGAAPTLTSTTVDHSTTRANFNTTTAGPTQRNDRSTSTHGRQYPKPHHVSDLPDRGLNSFRI